MGPFHAQAEYFDAEDGNDDVDGYYVQLGWVITGESRPYEDGKFKRVKPANKNGALELVLRYEEGDGKYSDVGLSSSLVNGEQTTVGLNYYVNDYVRVGLSYMDGEAENSIGQSFDGDELRARFQFAF
jgi:phosphate-selective porin OprO/OprP